jgi:hypothetical protein
MELAGSGRPEFSFMPRRVGADRPREFTGVLASCWAAVAVRGAAAPGRRRATHG